MPTVDVGHASKDVSGGANEQQHRLTGSSSRNCLHGDTVRHGNLVVRDSAENSDHALRVDHWQHFDELGHVRQIDGSKHGVLSHGRVQAGHAPSSMQECPYMHGYNSLGYKLSMRMVFLHVYRQRTSPSQPQQ